MKVLARHPAVHSSLATMKQNRWLAMATCLAYCPDRGLWKAIGHLKEQLKILKEQQEKDKRILLSNHQRMRLAAKAKQLTGRSTDEDRSCLRVLLADDHRIVR
jgi:hypothetical protein